jgi:subtilisin family serine protease
MIKEICNRHKNKIIRQLQIVLISFLFIFLNVQLIFAQEVAKKKEIQFSERKSSYIQNKILSNEELMEKVKKEGSVHIIVRLKVDFVPEGKISKNKGILAQREMISKLQNGLIKKLAPYEITGVKRYKYIPSVALIVNMHAMKMLLADKYFVERIELDLLRHLHLNDSRPLTGAKQAFDSGYGGMGWAIAVLDSGVDREHNFLRNKVVDEACFSDNLCPNNLNEQHGLGTGVNCSTNILGCDHGTHVAGIAAGWGGIAPYSGILSFQVFSKIEDYDICQSHDLPTPCILSYDSDQISALDWLYGHTYNYLGIPMSTPTYSVAAVNMSLGSGRYTTHCDDSSLKDIIDNLRWIGVATVISTGNDGYNNAISYPSCISTAISVGATRKTDGIATYSNRSTFMSLWAPGTNINSSVPGNHYERKSGTSMAAPHVAGAFAILKDASSNSMGVGIVDEILSALQTTGRQIPGSPSNNITRIQIDSAINH